ncbi:hypothetical protein BGZ61DRAFT_550823, partial [Ilyonectria robusta]|uniref:uncharacterized protein n=1 Tax=Ilyonectria robusta TaxID=1079257 RepID=UPI001E8ED3AE
KIPARTSVSWRIFSCISSSFLSSSLHFVATSLLLHQLLLRQWRNHQRVQPLLTPTLHIWEVLVLPDSRPSAQFCPVSSLALLVSLVSLAPQLHLTRSPHLSTQKPKTSPHRHRHSECRGTRASTRIIENLPSAPIQFGILITACPLPTLFARTQRLPRPIPIKPGRLQQRLTKLRHLENTRAEQNTQRHATVTPKSSTATGMAGARRLPTNLLIAFVETPCFRSK